MNRTEEKQELLTTKRVFRQPPHRAVAAAQTPKCHIFSEKDATGFMKFNRTWQQIFFHYKYANADTRDKIVSALITIIETSKVKMIQ